MAAQNFEYKITNTLDKPTESLFGYISVLVRDALLTPTARTYAELRSLAPFQRIGTSLYRTTSMVLARSPHTSRVRSFMAATRISSRPTCVRYSFLAWRHTLMVVYDMLTDLAEDVGGF